MPSPFLHGLARWGHWLGRRFCHMLHLPLLYRKNLLISCYQSFRHLCPELCCDGKADVPKFSISGSVGWHGQKYPFLTVHQPNIPYGQALVQVDGRRGKDTPIHADGINLYLYVHLTTVLTLWLRMWLRLLLCLHSRIPPSLT